MQNVAGRLCLIQAGYMRQGVDFASFWIKSFKIKAVFCFTDGTFMVLY